MRMLAGIPPDRLAQLYFHQEIPTRRCCLRYFELRTVRFCGLCLPDGRVDGLSTGMTLMKQPTAGWIAATWLKFTSSQGGVPLDLLSSRQYVGGRKMEELRLAGVGRKLPPGCDFLRRR